MNVMLARAASKSDCSKALVFCKLKILKYHWKSVKRNLSGPLLYGFESGLPFVS